MGDDQDLNQQRTSKLRFWALLSGAVVVFNLPLISIPFDWFETYCHEMSHGLMAVLTGGSIQSLVMRWDGSGALWHAGSFLPLLVTFSGYSGAIACGVLLYRVAAHMDAQYARPLTLGAAAVVFLSGIVLHSSAVGFGEWIQTTIVTTILAALLVVLFRFGDNKFIKNVMQFTGLYIVVAGSVSPSYQRGTSHSDAATLASATFIPALVWIGLWTVMGAGALYWCYRKR
jgi:hypothetical protein